MKRQSLKWSSLVLGLCFIATVSASAGTLGEDKGKKQGKVSSASTSRSAKPAKQIATAELLPSTEVALPEETYVGQNAKEHPQKVSQKNTGNTNNPTLITK
jgi:hypothetical protein